jgi:hypothetical protein
VTTNGPVVAIRDAGEFFYQISTNAFPPVMSYFEPQKRTTSGASFIESQRNRWASLCDAADVIGVVGVQPRIHDSHIWGPLSATKATIVYCSGAAGATAFNAWRSDCHRTRPDTILPGYFSQEFDELCRLLAL